MKNTGSAVVFATAIGFAASCSHAPVQRTGPSESPSPAPVSSAVPSPDTLRLDGIWATGGTGEPEARQLKLTLQCNYTPPMWAIEQSGDTVRALTLPGGRASGVPTPAPPPPVYSVGRLTGADVVLKGPTTRYVLRYDSKSGHLVGTLNGAPFWAVRQEVIHPKGCIPPP